LSSLIKQLVEALDLDKFTQGYRRRLLILDSQLEALRQEREALAEEREALRGEREKLAALYQINMRVLNIVNAPSRAGEPNATDFITRFTK